MSTVFKVVYCKLSGITATLFDFKLKMKPPRINKNTKMVREMSIRYRIKHTNIKQLSNKK